MLRRNFYTRYANLITLFDEWSPVFEHQLVGWATWLRHFDSTRVYWYYRTSWLAEIRAFRMLEAQIYQKQADEGDELTRAILELEKELS